jgi:hypothetical protein
MTGSRADSNPARRILSFALTGRLGLFGSFAATTLFGLLPASVNVLLQGCNGALENVTLPPQEFLHPFQRFEQLSFGHPGIPLLSCGLRRNRLIILH